MGAITGTHTLAASALCFLNTSFGPVMTIITPAARATTSFTAAKPHGVRRNSPVHLQEVLNRRKPERDIVALHSSEERIGYARNRDAPVRRARITGQAVADSFARECDSRAVRSAPVRVRSRIMAVR